MMGKKANYLLVFLIMFAMVPSVAIYAAPLTFDQGYYNSLTSAKQQELYMICNQGFRGVPLNSTRAQVYKKCGPPNYAANKNFIFYYDYYSFKLVGLQFKEDRLKAIIFSEPSTYLKRTTKAKIKEVLGIPGKEKGQKMIYETEDHMKVTIHRRNLLGFQEIQQVIIGEMTMRELWYWRLSALKTIPDLANQVG